MNEGRASAYRKEIRAETLPFEKEEIMRSLTYWNTAWIIHKFSLSLQENKS